MTIFQNEIQCIVSPEHFQFSAGGKKISLKTFLDITEGERGKIMSIGEDACHQEPVQRVFLFKTTSNTFKFRKIDYLEVYFRYAFKRVSNKLIIIRPTIIFRNTTSLISILSGYEDYILEQAAVKAGARKCEFK